jgi:hypothetical protein
LSPFALCLLFHPLHYDRRKFFAGFRNPGDSPLTLRDQSEYAKYIAAVQNPTRMETSGDFDQSVTNVDTQAANIANARIIKTMRSCIEGFGGKSSVTISPHGISREAARRNGYDGVPTVGVSRLRYV